MALSNRVNVRGGKSADSSVANDFYLSANNAITVDGVNYAQSATIVGMRADTTRLWSGLIKAQ